MASAREERDCEVLRVWVLKGWFCQWMMTLNSGHTEQVVRMTSSSIRNAWSIVSRESSRPEHVVCLFDINKRVCTLGVCVCTSTYPPLHLTLLPCLSVISREMMGGCLLDEKGLDASFRVASVYSKVVESQKFPLAQIV